MEQKKVCEWCKTPFVKKPHTPPNTRFCSTVCRNAWHGARKCAEGQEKREANAVCEWCGKQFRRSKGGPAARVCSNRCRAARWRAANCPALPAAAACVQCGANFKPKRQKQTFCSKHCLLAHCKKDYYKRYYEKSREKINLRARSSKKNKARLKKYYQEHKERIKAKVSHRYKVRMAEKMAPIADFISKSGWPEGLSVREVQTLNVLASIGLPVKSIDVASVIMVSKGYTCVLLTSLEGEGLVVRTCERQQKSKTTWILSAEALSIQEDRAKCDNLL